MNFLNKQNINSFIIKDKKLEINEKITIIITS